MKTFKLQKISEVYEEVIVEAETLEQAQEYALDCDWDEDGPILAKERYKVVESSGDPDADEEALDEEDWIVTYDPNSRD